MEANLERSILNLISLAKKAGAVKSGEVGTEETVKSGKAALVILAEDAGASTKKKFHNKSESYEVPCIEFSSRENLGRAIGKEFTAAVAVTDLGLAKAISDKFEGR